MPRPTASINPPAQAHVTTKPVGKNASFVPGTTNGVEVATRADAEEAAPEVVAVACFANTPLTNEASVEEMVVLMAFLVVGLIAERTTVGIRSG